MHIADYMCYMMYAILDVYIIFENFIQKDTSDLDYNTVNHFINKYFKIDKKDLLLSYKDQIENFLDDGMSKTNILHTLQKDISDLDYNTVYYFINKYFKKFRIRITIPINLRKTG